MANSKKSHPLSNAPHRSSDLASGSGNTGIHCHHDSASLPCIPLPPAHIPTQCEPQTGEREYEYEYSPADITISMCHHLPFPPPHRLLRSHSLEAFRRLDDSPVSSSCLRVSSFVPGMSLLLFPLDSPLDSAQLSRARFLSAGPCLRLNRISERGGHSEIRRTVLLGDWDSSPPPSALREAGGGGACLGELTAFSTPPRAGAVRRIKSDTSATSRAEVSFTRHIRWASLPPPGQGDAIRGRTQRGKKPSEGNVLAARQVRGAFALQDLACSKSAEVRVTAGEGSHGPRSSQ